MNLQCSYDVIYRWGEEALQNGTTFGRSNQYKKSSLQSKYADYVKGKGNSTEELRTFDYFLKSETSSLIKKLSQQNIPWFNNKNHLYFINTDHRDFHKSPCKNKNESLNQNIESYPLMRILTTMLVDDLFLNSLEKDTACSFAAVNRPIEYTESGNEDWLAMEDMSFTELTNFNNLFGNFPSFADSNVAPTLNIKYSLPNLALHSNYYYNRFITFPSDEQKLISYFIDTICPTCVCYSNIKKTAVDINPIYLIDKTISVKQWEKNPYLFLIIPLAFTSDIVMDVVMATSAYQLYLSGNCSFEKVSKFYSERAIKKLPDLIREKQCLHSLDWDELLATVLLLCFREISATPDSISIWMMYLNYAKYFVTQINALNASSPLANFFARYFITHEVIRQTALLDIKENSSNNTSTIDETIYLNSSVSDNRGRKEFMKFIQKQGITGDLYLKTLKDKDTIINIVFGCCPYLICLTHQVSCFADYYENLALETTETKQEFEVLISNRREQLKCEIESINQEVQILEDGTDGTELIIKAIAEIRRLSTLIYLFLRIDLEGLYQCSGVVTKQFLRYKKGMEKAKAKMVELLNTLPEISMALLWPIFVLGVVTANYENERWFVLDKLNKIQMSRKSASLRAAEEVILAIWKETDLGVSMFRWRDLLIDKRESLSLALIN